MQDIGQSTVFYFSAPATYFWRWSENGEAVEWFDVQTIAYTEDILSVLRGLEGVGFPNFGTLLLILAACQTRWKDRKRLEDFDAHLAISGSSYWKREEKIESDAKKFLQVINDLPAELRSGSRRVHLIREILKAQMVRQKGYPVQAENTRAVLDELASGRSSQRIFGDFTHSASQQFLQDLAPLYHAWKQFPSPLKLAQFLRTGLEELPAPLELPELPLPETAPLNLLDELAQDKKTAGLALLCRRLIAALNIPMHAQGASDLPLGGVADISNRGDFDRLLLSELAYDDMTLTARLANNEALFLRREEPPANLDRQRIILVDNTLKMWGIPRVFALSAALACAQNTRHVTEVSAFSLGARSFTPIDLQQKQGILNALEQLDAGLHCGEALQSFFTQASMSGKDDYILISGAEAMKGPDFQRMFASVKDRLRFLIVLQRDGSLQFFEFIGGRAKLIGQPKFDLDTLLFDLVKPQKAGESGMTDKMLPAFIRGKMRSLYFPITSSKIDKYHTSGAEGIGFVCVTNRQRVLFFPSFDKAGVEIMPQIEKGQYCIGFGPNSEIYIMVMNRGLDLKKLYKIDPGNNFIFEVVLGLQPAHDSWMAYRDNVFYFRKGAYDCMLDCATNTVSNPSKIDLNLDVHQKFEQLPTVPNIYPYVRLDYSTLQQCKHIYITPEGRLAIDKHYLNCQTQHLNNHLSWDTYAGFQKTTAENMTMHNGVGNKTNKLFVKTWSDGSRAMLDSRGLLHLIPSDPSKPEVSILLVLQKTTAAWASDGKICGNPYFTNCLTENIVSPEVFYAAYIQPFINLVS